ATDPGTLVVRAGPRRRAAHLDRAALAQAAHAAAGAGRRRPRPAVARPVRRARRDRAARVDDAARAGRPREGPAAVDDPRHRPPGGARSRGAPPPRDGRPPGRAERDRGRRRPAGGRAAPQGGVAGQAARRAHRGRAGNPPPGRPDHRQAQPRLTRNRPRPARDRSCPARDDRPWFGGINPHRISLAELMTSVDDGRGGAEATAGRGARGRRPLRAPRAASFAAMSPMTVKPRPAEIRTRPVRTDPRTAPAAPAAQATPAAPAAEAARPQDAPASVPETPAEPEDPDERDAPADGGGGEGKEGRAVGGMFRSLRNRNYRLFAAGQVVSNTGTWMQRVGQDWLVLELTHGSGTALGITTGLQFLPMLLF